LRVSVGSFVADTRRRFCLVGIYSARREETIRRHAMASDHHASVMNLEAMVYQGKGALERSTKKARPPAKIASRCALT